MDRFVAYLSQFDLGFAGRIRGASLQQISELERLVGRSLPEAYHSFLLTMGLQNGGISIAFEGTTEITDILDFYRSEIANGQFIPPDDTLLIGVGAISIPNIALDLNQSKEPPVVFVDGDEIIGLYSESLEKLLFNTGFSQFRLKKFSQRVFVSGSYAQVGKQNASSIARAIALEHGFQPMWFADRISFSAERMGAALQIVQFEQQGIGISIAGVERGEVARVVSAMSQHLNLGPAEWQGTLTGR